MMQLVAQIILPLIRAILAVVLVAAGAAKLADVTGFAHTLYGLGVPGHWKYLVRGLALVVPLLEICLGLGLMAGLWPTIINSAVLILMCGFNALVLVALRKAPHVACRCFGALSDSQFSVKGLIRSLFLTLLAIMVFWSGITGTLQLNGSLASIVLLVAGYLLFAIAAAQAARTIATIKERMSL